MMKQYKVSIDQVKPNEDNPRYINDDNFKKLVKSITDFPEMLELRPLVVDENMTVLGGNMRLQALKHLGHSEIYITQIKGLTEAQKREFVIKDNLGYGLWDYDILANEWDQELLLEWGMEIDFATDEPEADDDEYDEPEEIETDIVKGDHIEIGDHVLLCGDSTSYEEVSDLMRDERASMVFTDPPYDMPDESYHTNIQLFTENAHVFVMHDDRGIVDYLRLSQLVFLRFFVADFGFSSPRGNDPYLSHILVSHEKNGKPIAHKNLKDGFSSIVKMKYRGNLKESETSHKHEKSIEFVEKFVKHYSNEGDLILDLFMGSGTTLVTAHQLNRVCYGMELDPKFCQMTIDRMRKLDPDIEIKINGKRYE